MFYFSFIFLVVFIFANSNLLSNVKNESVQVESGYFKQMFGFDTTTIKLNAVIVDITPVTNLQYLAFVKKNKEWKKSKVKSIFADKNYLRNWLNDTILGPKIEPNAPVTNISWFAAKEYCECQGKRLPSTNEWEFIADKLQFSNLNLTDSAFYNMLLLWYGKPAKEMLPKVKSGFVNKYGIYDLHGLAFEWVYDYGATMLSGESRKDGAIDRNAYCASGSQVASNLRDYAAYMRYSIRSSLKGNYTVNNLGFRCVKNDK